MFRFLDVELSKRLKISLLLSEGRFYHLLCNTREEIDALFLKLSSLNKGKGEIFIESTNLHRCSEKNRVQNLRDYSVVYTDLKFLEYKTVFENLEYYLKIRKYSKKERIKIIEDTLNMFGLYKMKDLYVNKLSIIEKILLGIVRAILTKPKYIIIDEVHRKIDIKIWEKIFKIFTDMKTGKTTLLYITTDKKIIEKYKRQLGEDAGGAANV